MYQKHKLRAKIAILSLLYIALITESEKIQFFKTLPVLARALLGVALAGISGVVYAPEAAWVATAWRSCPVPASFVLAAGTERLRKALRTNGLYAGN